MRALGRVNFNLHNKFEIPSFTVSDIIMGNPKSNKSSAVAEMGDRLATINTGRKLGTVLFLARGSWTQSNTMSPGPKPTSVPSGILIYPAVWPQRTWVKNWGTVPFFGEAGHHLTQCGRGLGRGLPPCQVSS